MGDTGVLTSMDFPEYGFCNDITLSDPPLACYAFLVQWKNCVGSQERISGSGHEHVNVQNLISDIEFSLTFRELKIFSRQHLHVSICHNRNNNKN